MDVVVPLCSLSMSPFSLNIMKWHFCKERGLNTKGTGEFRSVIYVNKKQQTSQNFSVG